MHKCSLKFIDPLLEAHYQSQNLSHQTKLFSTFIIFQFCFLCFLSVTITIKNPTNYDHIVIFCLSAVFLFILWRIRFKWTNLFKLGLQLFFLAFGLILTEMALLIRVSDDWIFSPETVAFIIPIQSFCSMMILVRLNWVLSSLIYFINLVYFLLRMVDIQSYGSQLFIWVGLFMAVLNFSYIAFREQKIFRELFKKNHDSYENLNLFHLLLRNVLPSSIFIINYEKDPPAIEFINFQALKLMNKTLEENCFIGKSRCIDCSLQFPNRCRSDDGPFPSDPEVDYSKIKEFLGKMNVLDQHFDSYQNNIHQILFDHFQSKIVGYPKGINKEIHFVSINLSRTKISDHVGTPFVGRLMKPEEMLNSEKARFLDKELDKEHASGLEAKLKYYELKGAKIKWNDKDCLLVLLSDITKSKKIIELKNLDRHKNQLLASISHDLRTPLNGVIGMINATISEVSDDRLKDFLKIALRSANLLDFLIKDILDFSQMSYKQLRLNIEEFDIKGVIQEVFSLMKFQSRTRPITLELESLIPVGLCCKSDPNRLKQILINLLGNAIKFTKQGSVKLKVELIFSQDFQRKLIKFSVSDTGIGIRKDDQPKLFQLFGKLNQEDPEINKHGIGLGLAISHSLAKLLAPQNEDSGLHVESCFGQGSTFWFFADVGSLESPKKKTPLTSISSGGNPLLEQSIELRFPVFNNDNTKPSVLIVDDDMVNLFVLEKYLENFKIDVMRAMNGIEALDVVEKEVLPGRLKLSLILMDCHMPLMNGLEATEAILSVLDNAKMERIPIFGISANDSQEEVEKCLKAGMVKFIVKPIKREEFCKLVGEFLVKERLLSE